jgi:hypothetical protein
MLFLTAGEVDDFTGCFGVFFGGFRIFFEPFEMPSF